MDAHDFASRLIVRFVLMGRHSTWTSLEVVDEIKKQYDLHKIASTQADAHAYGVDGFLGPALGRVHSESALDHAKRLQSLVQDLAALKGVAKP